MFLYIFLGINYRRGSATRIDNMKSYSGDTYNTWRHNLSKPTPSQWRSVTLSLSHRRTNGCEVDIQHCVETVTKSCQIRGSSFSPLATCSLSWPLCSSLIPAPLSFLASDWVSLQFLGLGGFSLYLAIVFLLPPGTESSFFWYCLVQIPYWTIVF